MGGRGAYGLQTFSPLGCGRGFWSAEPGSTRPGGGGGALVWGGRGRGSRRGLPRRCTRCQVQVASGARGREGRLGLPHTGGGGGWGSGGVPRVTPAGDPARLGKESIPSCGGARGLAASRDPSPPWTRALGGVERLEMAWRSSFASRTLPVSASSTFRRKGRAACGR